MALAVLGRPRGSRRAATSLAHGVAIGGVLLLLTWASLAERANTDGGHMLERVQDKRSNHKEMLGEVTMDDKHDIKSVTLPAVVERDTRPKEERHVAGHQKRFLKKGSAKNEMAGYRGVPVQDTNGKDMRPTKPWPPPWISKTFGNAPSGLPQLPSTSLNPGLSDIGIGHRLFAMPFRHKKWVRPLAFHVDHKYIEPLAVDTPEDEIDALPLPEDEKKDPIAPLPLPEPGEIDYRKLPLEALPLPKVGAPLKIEIEAKKERENQKQQIPPDVPQAKDDVPILPPKIPIPQKKAPPKKPKKKPVRKTEQLYTLQIRKFKSGWFNNFKLKDLVFGNTYVLRRMLGNVKEQETILKLKTGQGNMKQTEKVVSKSAAREAAEEADKYEKLLEEVLGTYQDASMMVEELVTKCNNVLYVARTSLPLLDNWTFDKRKIDHSDALRVLDKQLSEDEILASNVEITAQSWNTGVELGRLQSKYEHSADLLYYARRKYKNWHDVIQEKFGQLVANYEAMDTSRKRALESTHSNELKTRLKSVQTRVEIEEMNDKENFKAQLGTLKRWVELKRGEKANEISARLAKLESEMAKQMQALTNTASLGKGITDYYWKTEKDRLRQLRDKIQLAIPAIVKSEDLKFAQERDKSNELWTEFEMPGGPGSGSGSDSATAVAPAPAAAELLQLSEETVAGASSSSGAEPTVQEAVNTAPLGGGAASKSNKCRACSCFPINSFGIVRLQEELGMPAPPYRVKFHIDLTNLPNIPQEESVVGEELLEEEERTGAAPAAVGTEELKAVDGIEAQDKKDQAKKEEAKHDHSKVDQGLQDGLKKLLEALAVKDHTLDPGQICECTTNTACP